MMFIEVETTPTTFSASKKVFININKIYSICPDSEGEGCFVKMTSDDTATFHLTESTYSLANRINLQYKKF